jgi:hypothetical protein
VNHNETCRDGCTVAGGLFPLDFLALRLALPSQAFQLTFHGSDERDSTGGRMAVANLSNCSGASGLKPLDAEELDLFPILVLALGAG